MKQMGCGWEIGLGLREVGSGSQCHCGLIE